MKYECEIVRELYYSYIYKTKSILLKLNRSFSILNYLYLLYFQYDGLGPLYPWARGPSRRPIVTPRGGRAPESFCGTGVRYV